MGLQHELADAREKHALLEGELAAQVERAGAAEAREKVSAQKLMILNSQYTRMLAAGVSMVEIPDPTTPAEPASAF